MASIASGVKKPVEVDKSRIVGFGSDPDPCNQAPDEWDELSTSVISAAATGLDTLKVSMGGGVESATDAIADAMDSLGGWINTSSSWFGAGDGASPTIKDSDEKELVIMSEGDAAEDTSAARGGGRRKDESAGSASQVIEELCTIRSTKVIPTVSQLDYFCDRVSGLRMHDVVQEMSSRLSYSAGETQWQPRLRILYGMKALHENGMGAVFTKLLKEVEDLVTSLRQLPECAEMAQRVLDLKHVPASDPLTEVEAIKRRRQRRRQEGSQACDTALLSFDDDDSGVAGSTHGQPSASSTTSPHPGLVSGNDPLLLGGVGSVSAHAEKKDVDAEMLEELLGMGNKRATMSSAEPSLMNSSLLDDATRTDCLSREAVAHSAASHFRYPSIAPTSLTAAPTGSRPSNALTSSLACSTIVSPSSPSNLNSSGWGTTPDTPSANTLLRRDVSQCVSYPDSNNTYNTNALSSPTGIQHSTTGSSYPAFPPPPVRVPRSNGSPAAAVSSLALSSSFVDQFPPIPEAPDSRTSRSFEAFGSSKQSSPDVPQDLFFPAGGAGAGAKGAKGSGKNTFQHSALNFTGLGPADYSPSIDLQKKFSPLAATSLAYSSPTDLCNKADTHFEFVNELFDKQKLSEGNVISSVPK